MLPHVCAHLHSTPNPPTPPPPPSNPSWPQEDSSEYETDSEEEEAGGGRRLVKPVFVPKSQREVGLLGASWPGGEGVCHPGASLRWALKRTQVWWLTGVLCCEGLLLLLPPPPCWPSPMYGLLHAHHAAPLPALNPLPPCTQTIAERERLEAEEEEAAEAAKKRLEERKVGGRRGGAGRCCWSAAALRTVAMQQPQHNLHPGLCGPRAVVVTSGHIPASHALHHTYPAHI